MLGLLISLSDTEVLNFVCQQIFFCNTNTIFLSNHYKIFTTTSLDCYWSHNFFLFYNML